MHVIYEGFFMPETMSCLWVKHETTKWGLMSHAPWYCRGQNDLPMLH